MAVEFVAKASAAGAGVSSQAVTLPSEIRAGDLIVVAAVTRGDRTLTTLASPWTEDRNYVASAINNNPRYAIWHKTADGTEAGTSLTINVGGGSGPLTVGVTVHRPVHPTMSYWVAQVDGAISGGTTPMLPAIDVRSYGLYIGVAAVRDSDGGTFTIGSVYTERVDACTASGTNRAGLLIADYIAGVGSGYDPDTHTPRHTTTTDTTATWSGGAYDGAAGYGVVFLDAPVVPDDGNPAVPVDSVYLDGTPIKVGWNGAFFGLHADLGGTAWTLADPAASATDPTTLLSRLDYNALGPALDGWVDMSCDLMELESVRGATRDDGVLTRVEAGTMTLALNDWDARYDPLNTGSPWHDTFRIGTPVRFVAGASEYLDPTHEKYGYMWRPFAGRVSEIRVEGYADETPMAVVTVLDGTAALQRYNAEATSPEVGLGDDIAERMDRILDMVGWPDADRLYVTNDHTELGSTALAQPAWTEMLLAADSTRHTCFVDGYGRVQIIPAQGVNTEYDDQVDVAFGFETGEVRLFDVEVAFDDTQLRNYVDVARAGGTVQSFTNESSIARYGDGIPSRWGRNDLELRYDADVATFGLWVLAFSSEVEARVEAITLAPQFFPRENIDGDHTSSWDGILPNSDYLGWGKHTVRFQHPRTGDTFTQYVATRGVEHRIDMQAETWTVRFVTSSLDSLLDVWTLADPSWSLEDAEQSRFDRGHRLGSDILHIATP